MSLIKSISVVSVLALAGLGAWAEEPASLARAQFGSGAVTLRYDAVSVDGSVLAAPGAFIDLTEEGVALLDTPIELRAAGSTLPAGQYRVRVHRSDAETWVLLLEGSGHGRGPAMPDAVVTRVPLVHQTAAQPAPKLRVELQPSANSLQLHIFGGTEALTATFQAG